ncbi:terminase small subunit-like protein [Mariniphaga sediminis]|uniref:terminase small subunit-like protein n=1 Tax=Mariniphaga sediminis TaxID=1628158 RepID=UPI0035675153
MNAYTEEDKKEIWNSILSEMISGRSLRSIMNDPGMPNRDTIYTWMAEDETKSDQYARCASIRADIIFDELLDIADSTDDDIITLDDGKQSINHHVINRDRLRVDSRKWVLSKMNPKKYGDRIEIDNKNVDHTIPEFKFKNLNDDKKK